MRWKLLRRRLSVSAPRMIVRSHLPWPLRWAALAVMFGFSAAIALWAFELGKDLAGLDRNDHEELLRLRAEIVQLRTDHQQATQVANTADSLLRTERATQERLAQQVRQLEADKQALRADLGFYERLLPTSGEGLQLRGLQAEVSAPGQVRYQLLIVQSGKALAEFKGRYDLLLTGQLEGKAWSQALPGGPQVLQMRQVTRLEGLIDHPPEAVIKAMQVRVMDAKGVTRATQTVSL
ncbi:MAG: hypothetical protein Q8R98_01790 [Rubrivivax sp.]|nr:hypothetical protein [Rubrivivax sp.]MDP3610562.1 hypothetical protein [Rubrivivax sp.]